MSKPWCKIHIGIIILLLGLSVVVNAQSSDIGIQRRHYISQFEHAKKLIKEKKYEKAKPILKNLIDKKDIDIVGCKIHSEISNKYGVCYFMLDENVKALTIWKEQTLPLRKNCDSVDIDRLAQTIYNIGNAYYFLNNYTEAKKYIFKALGILDSNGLLYTKVNYAKMYKKLYYIENKINDYNKAEAYLFMALSIMDSLSMSRAEYTGSTYLNLVKNFIDKGEYILAQKYLSISYKILKDLNSNDLGRLFRYYGILYQYKKQYKKSLHYCNKAVEFLKDKKEYLDLSSAYETRGLTLSYSGRSKEALVNYRKTLKLRKEHNAYNSSISLIYENIAGAYGRLNMLDSALYYIDLSIKQSHSVKKAAIYNKYPELRGNDFPKYDMVRKLQMRGKYLSRSYNKNKNIDFLLEAEKSFAQADSLIFLMKQDIVDKNSKVILSSNMDSVYRYAINNAYTLWKATKEKKYLQKSYYYTAINKAPVFSERRKELDFVRNMLSDSMQKVYYNNMEELKQNLYEKQYAALKNDTITYKKLNIKFLALEKEKKKILNEIKMNYPLFYRVLSSSQKPKSISEIQAKLDSNNAVIEYFISEKDLFTYVITKDTMIGIKKATGLNLNSLFSNFNEELRRFNNKESIFEASKKVYPVLFPDEVKDILTKESISRLIVIRDKNMNQITFAPINTTKSIKNMTSGYLINKYSFSYAFNINSVWQNIGGEKKSYQFGGFATNYNGTTLASLRKDTMYWEDDFPQMFKPLEQSLKEVDYMMNIFDTGQKWKGEEATVENFKSNANKYDILHLSLHTILTENADDQNAMIFQKISNGRNYLLKAEDIPALKLNNSLTVLSSCFTSDGDVVKGEGIRSIARKFSLAGSPTIIASQWQAYEGQSIKLMMLFYENLRKGYPKDVAMQKAQLIYIDEVDNRYTSPANWANMVIVGNPKLVEGVIEYSIFTLTNLIYLLIFVLIIVLVVNRKKFKTFKKKSKN